MPGKIIVVTAAYGHDEIARRQGQQGVLSIIAEAGADGVEIRRELLTAAERSDLAPLNARIKALGLMACYSAPEPLCLEDGAVNPNIPALLAEAEQLDAEWLKLSLGHFHASEPLDALGPWLANTGTRLVIENDQTECGRLAPMARFADAARRAHWPVTLTFDMANWLWVGDEPEQAADRLASAVSYIHVKAAYQDRGKIRAIALDDADPRWRRLLKSLPDAAPRGIEFPLQGGDLAEITRHYVQQLRKE